MNWPAVGWTSAALVVATVLILAHSLRRQALDTDDSRVVGQSQVDAYAALDQMAWPEHSADPDCWCRLCYDAEIGRMQDVEITALFAGLTDTPELRRLADQARRWVR